jgi:hypothetical protein
MGSSMIGRTENERDLLRVEGGSDLDGDNQLPWTSVTTMPRKRSTTRRECEEDGGGVASFESEEWARLAWHCVHA